MAAVLNAACVLLIYAALITGSTSPRWRTEQQHVEKVCTPVPEGSLLQGLAVANEEKHVKHKVQAWVEVEMLLHRVLDKSMLLV